MRSNRSGYSAAPAGSAKALRQKPRPKRPKQEWNQLFLMLFFIVLPVIGLLAIFFQPVRWIFMFVTVASLLMMWLMRAFLFPGRMIVTAVYGLMLVFTLVTALGEQNDRAQISNQQNRFMSHTAAPTQTPLMITYVAEDYAYSDMLSDFDDMQEVGLSGGSGDESGMDLGLTDTGATDYVSAVKSGAEESLAEFMDKWRKSIIADMVEVTPPSWRNQQEGDSARQQLFWKFGQRPLVDWRQMSAPTGTDASTARTITVEADVNYGGATRTYQYDAVLLRETENGDEKWFVDPNSLSSGILVVAATATPDPNMTPTPSPVPTPTPTPGPKTKLYYNKDGGKKYHADQNCPSVAQKYLPLSGSFTYKDLVKSPYTRLEPCEKCEAPAR